MKFFDSQITERIGFDFYCDIANNIVEARKRKGYTQKELAKVSGIKEQRISNMENVKVRIDLDVLEKLAKALDVSVDYLIDEEFDHGGEECLYLVWAESLPDFRLYQEGSSKRMAFLNFDRALKKCGVAYSSSRERFFVKLVGIPRSKKEIQAIFPKRATEDLPLERDETETQK